MYSPLVEVLVVSDPVQKNTVAGNNQFFSLHVYRSL